MIASSEANIERKIIDKVVKLLIRDFGKPFVDNNFSVVKDYILESKFDSEKYLNLFITIESRRVTIGYNSLNYSNYSELEIGKNEDSESVAIKLAGIVQAYIVSGANRKDVYKNNKLISSTIEIENVEMTKEIKGFSLFGRKTVKLIHYPGPAEH